MLGFTLCAEWTDDEGAQCGQLAEIIYSGDYIKTRCVAGHLLHGPRDILTQLDQTS